MSARIIPMQVAHKRTEVSLILRLFRYPSAVKKQVEYQSAQIFSVIDSLPLKIVVFTCGMHAKAFFLQAESRPVFALRRQLHLLNTTKASLQPKYNSYLLFLQIIFPLNEGDALMLYFISFFVFI